MEPAAPVTSWDFIKQNYRADDRIAIVIRNRHEDYTLQRLLSAQDAASPRIQRFLRYENAHGADIYVSMNILKPAAKSRTKADIAEISHLYLDLDEDGDKRLARVLKGDALPQPNYVLDTSPGKHQVIWKVEGFTLEQAEAALRAMAREFGGDPAATDAARVLRLPGLHNKKFKEPVRVQGQRLYEGVYRPEKFATLPAIPEACLTNPGKPHVPLGTRRDGGPLSQSERDWAWVRNQLRAGASPEAVRRELVGRRQDKSDPTNYAERTVWRALSR
ncbi:MAG TPA: DNA-primase RepB domain-containing protein [Verrucomicrobiae bacterium]|nr:DNA-primase RepB domain-containing protein [Verrucomicrobiae bacterium]